MEQGWLYIGKVYCIPDFYADGLRFETGSAIRMAQDLGLNRNADKWQYRGNDLFNSQEKQMRKQLWFACVMADEYSAVYMGQQTSLLPILESLVFIISFQGRSVTIGEYDFDTLLPNVDQQEENEPWAPAHCDPMQIDHVPVPGRIMSCFRAAASLCESCFAGQ
jgi:hypothetical protein